MPVEDYEIRPAVAADRPAIIDLLAASLKRDRDPRFSSLYDWKHLTNSFGPSLAYVAVAQSNGDLAGFRAFMRWRYRRGPRLLRAVRAVDTVTHPDHQGRGLFTRLTNHALGEARAAGIGFVFNTPNEQSRPGYLKMGWQVAGRIPIAVRVRTPGGLPRMLRARTPAERWSQPCDAGLPVEEVLADEAAAEHLLASQPRTPNLCTDRSLAYLRWRYGGGGLSYRALVAPGGPAEGMAVFRVRRRGAAREIVLNEMLVPDGDRHTAGRLTRSVLREVEGDYLIGTAPRRTGSTGWIPLPRQGPILTWRALVQTTMPPLSEWNLTMGDIELF